MSDTFFNVLKPSFKDLQLHYMDNDSFIISYSEVNFPDEYTELSNLDIPIKTDKVLGKFQYEFGSKIIDELIVFFIKNKKF